MESVTGQPATDKTKAPADVWANRSSATLASVLKSEPIDKSAARALGQTCPTPYSLIGIKRLAGQSQASIVELEELLKSTEPNPVAAVHEGIAVALVPHADAERALQGSADKGKFSKYAIAVSLPFSSVRDIPQQFDLLRFCLSEGNGGEIIDAKDLALSYLLAEIAGNVRFEGLLHPALDTLAHYDENNQSNLLETLRVYLDNDRNAQRCANALYLHRNSLQYRVRRIQEIASLNLDDPAERAYLRLSFMLRKR